MGFRTRFDWNSEDPFDLWEAMGINPQSRKIPGQPMPEGPGQAVGQGMMGRLAFEDGLSIAKRLAAARGFYNGGDEGRENSRSFLDSIGDAVRTRIKRGGSAGSGVAESLGNLGRGPSIAEIMARLQELQDPSRYLSEDSALAEQAMAAASAQYDPLISQLKNQMGIATNRANQNKVALGQMFNALSSDIGGQVPVVQKDFATEAANTDKAYDALAQSITDQYANTQKEQEDMMNRLGIQAAASDVLPSQMRDKDYFVNMANTEGQAQQSALGLEKNAAVSFTREGANLAKHEGVSRQADLMADLQDLLAEYEGQIGAHSAAMQSAFSANLGQLQQQMLDTAYDRADREAQNYLTMIQLGRDLKADEREELELAQGDPITAVKSPSDIAGRVMGMGLSPEAAQRLQSVFMSTIGNDPAILSGANSLTGESLPREALAARIMEAGKKSGLNQSELNALMVAALEYFGRR